MNEVLVKVVTQTAGLENYARSSRADWVTAAFYELHMNEIVSICWKIFLQASSERPNMAVELGGITLEHLTHISVRERARIVQHAVPGMSGDFAQALGRPSVEVFFRGIFYGATAGDDLEQLRSAYRENQPVDFFTETVGEGYFSEVLIARLEVSQRAGYLDQFDFECEVMEYVQPPEPAAADPFGALDAGLLDEAAAFMDEVQNALDQVSQLTDLIANVPAFGDPTGKLPEMLDQYKDAASGGATVLAGIRDLF